MITVDRYEVMVLRLTLTPKQALQLSYMLKQYAREAQDGNYGTGTTVDDDIALALEIMEQLQKATAS